MKKNIIRICNEIKSNNSCNGCGGDFNNHTCRYCGDESLVLKDLINELMSNLESLSDCNSDVLNALYSIRGLNIKVVNDLLNNYNYEEELENQYKEIFNAVLSDRCGKWAYKQLIYFLDNDLFVGNNRNYLINFLMKKLLSFELELDVETILVLIKNFVEMFMRSSFKNPRCIYDKLEENVMGNSFANVVSLDRDIVIEMIEAEDFEGILQLCFHECTHTTQDYFCEVLKKVNYNVLIQTKEKLIRRFFNNYYNENYANYNTEVEARYHEANLTIMYLKMLELPILNEQYFKSIMETEKEFIFYDVRTINGIKTTVDEAFSLYVTDASVLERYPVLNVQYKNNSGKIELKTREEILDDYEKYKRGEFILNGEQIEIQVLYDYLLGGKKYKNVSI